ncbi:MAG: electron transfer flavoprotein subunit alpha/FixB family protein [Candidatus Accumulibacter sp.]|jgi:electron transfer flavoprotein alpha subunit|nr:electron transfer flavoprotein subunit alpha/FixB family protein [Accumulibacter sp.]
MRSLVLAERGVFRTTGPATLAAAGAAARIGAETDLLVAGAEDGYLERAVSEAARIQGISNVLFSAAAHYADPSPENIAALAESAASRYSHILAPSTAFWRSALPRLAALLGVAQISDVVAVESPEIFTHSVYSGSALVRVRPSDAIKLMTVRTSAFKPAAREEEGKEERARIVRIPALPDQALSRIVSRKAGEDEGKGGRPGLTAARAVVTGGRGLGSAEAYRRLLEPLAERLGAALGATRAAVDSGFASHDRQIGQTGKTVAPRLYVAAGLSGAIQHLAGMRDSRIIVAINSDADAPIFQVADCGLVADAASAIPELLEALGDAPHISG